MNDLSPSVLSSFVMLNFEENLWTWRDLVESNFSNENLSNEMFDDLKMILIDYINRIESIEIQDKTNIEISFQSKISMAITLLKSYLKNDKCAPVDLRSLVEYTLLWSFITHVHPNHKKQFENWWRQTFHHIPKAKSVIEFTFLI